MPEVTLLEIGEELLSHELISKVELRAHKAREKTIQEMFAHRMDINKKREIIGLKQLDLISKSIDFAHRLINRLQKSSDNSKISSLQREMYLRVLDNTLLSSRPQLESILGEAFPAELHGSLLKKTQVEEK